MNEQQKNPHDPAPIFIVGCPRSGTSLLRNLLRSHPSLAFPEESHFIPIYHDRFGDPKNEEEAVRLARAILNEHWIRWWDIFLEPKQFRHCRKFSEMVDTLFSLYARQAGKKRWGDKTPQYVEHIELLHSLFPSARIIHIIRDGRDVALSWRGPWFGPKNTFHAALLWKKYVLSGMSAGRKLSPSQYLEVHYEKLVTRPEENMKAMCQFIGETYDPSVLTPRSTGKWMGQKKLIGKKKIARPKYIDSGRAFRWKTEMTASAQRKFERVAGDLLQNLGYEIHGYPRRQFSSLEKAVWVALSLLRSNAARLNRQYTYKNWLPGMLKRAAFLSTRAFSKTPRGNRR